MVKHTQTIRRQSTNWLSVFDHFEGLVLKGLRTPIIKPFHATDLFLYPLKISKNLWFSDVFKGYRKRSVACNGLIKHLAVITGRNVAVNIHPIGSSYNDLL